MLQKLCGTDVALYCIWLRYAAVFFWIVTLINIGIVVLYLSGDPTWDDDYRNA